MAAPTKAERQSDELIKALLEANTRMVEAVMAAFEVVVRPIIQVDPVIKNITDPQSVPAVPRFEDIPEDDWDKPERLWIREEEEDASHLAAVNGEPDVDPVFMAAVLKEAGFPNTEIS